MIGAALKSGHYSDRLLIPFKRDWLVGCTRLGCLRVACPGKLAAHRPDLVVLLHRFFPIRSFCLILLFVKLTKARGGHDD